MLNLRGCVRGYCVVRVCLRRTSSVCTSHGGGGDDLSYSRMVSSVTLLYLKSVSGPSWRSNACRRYRQPRSVGVPGHEDTLSVSSQSEVSSALRADKLAPRVRQTVQEVTHSTESGLRASRRHWRVRCPKRSVMSSLRQRAVAIARLNRLLWASRMIIDGGESASPAVRAVSEDVRGAREIFTDLRTTATWGPSGSTLDEQTAECTRIAYPRDTRSRRPVSPQSTALLVYSLTVSVACGAAIALRLAERRGRKVVCPPHVRFLPSREGLSRRSSDR